MPEKIFQKVERNNPVPLYIQVKEAIRRAIVEGILKPRQLLPSERQMCHLFGVSHISIRQALVELTRDGLLFRVPGKGTYVAEKLCSAEKGGAPIGIVIPSTNGGLCSPFVSDFLLGIKSVTCTHGQDVLVFTDTENGYLEPGKKNSLQGVILTEPTFSDNRVKKLQKMGTPFVVLGRTQEQNVSTVDVDHQKIFYLLTEHLLKSGHKKIGFINGPKRLTVCQDKLNGYRMALQKYGIGYEKTLVKHGAFSEISGYENARKILKYSPTALVCADDFISVGALRAIREKGLSVPEDISLCGCHNSSFTQHTIPSLTTADIFPSLLGRKAAEKLIRLIRGEKVELRTIIPGKILIRESTRRIR